MAIQYEIEDGVVILRATADGFTHLRAALDAVNTDPAARPRMPLLFDLRGEPPAVRYKDIRSRMQILTEMRQQFGGRWAFLVDPGPLRAGIAQMIAALAGQLNLDIESFNDSKRAMGWLTGTDANATFKFRIYVGRDESGFFAWLRREDETPEGAVSWRLTGATDDEDYALQLLALAQAEATVANRGEPD